MLKRRAMAGQGEAALLALRQPAGHGRLGRPWRSIEGNLHLSVLLRPATLRFPGHWSLLAAVALLEAVRGVLPGDAARLKWPNDVLLDGAKLAGILLEAGSDGGPWLVIGFGVNLAGAPQDIGRPVACVADRVTAPAPAAFAPLVVKALQSWRARYEREGFEPVRAAWLTAGPAPGSAMAVLVGERRIEGCFGGIDADGGLMVDGAEGVVRVAAGVVE